MSPVMDEVIGSDMVHPLGAHRESCRRACRRRCARRSRWPQPVVWRPCRRRLRERRAARRRRSGRRRRRGRASGRRVRACRTGSGGWKGGLIDGHVGYGSLAAGGVIGAQGVVELDAGRGGRASRRRRRRAVLGWSGSADRWCRGRRRDQPQRDCRPWSTGRGRH